MNQRGFTLIELLLVITFIALIAAFVWTSLIGTGKAQELNNATRSIGTLLRDAQQRSITQVDGRYWGMRFLHATAGKRYIVFSATSLPDVGQPPGFATTTDLFLKPFLEFRDPTPVEGILTIGFKQVTGEWSSPSCPGAGVNSTIIIGIVGRPDESTIKVYCNGRVEF